MNEAQRSECRVERVVISADAICGNCGKPYKTHFFEKCGDEDRVYCFTNTNGDVFTDAPCDDEILRMILDDQPDMYERYLIRWQKANGHL